MNDNDTCCCACQRNDSNQHDDKKQQSSHTVMFNVTVMLSVNKRKHDLFSSKDSFFIYFHVYRYVEFISEGEEKTEEQHKKAIVLQNRIYSHGTATNEIKLKDFLVEKNSCNNDNKNNSNNHNHQIEQILLV